MRTKKKPSRKKNAKPGETEDQIYVYFYNSEGNVFESRPKVAEHLGLPEAALQAAEEADRGTPAPEKLAELRKYLVSRGADANGLLDGWVAYARPGTRPSRKAGAKPGETETAPAFHFYDSAGKRFRSKPEVAKHLGLVVA